MVWPGEGVWHGQKEKWYMVQGKGMELTLPNAYKTYMKLTT